MANALYDAGREAFLSGDISWDVDTIKAVLTRDAPVLATDNFLDDVATIVSTSGTFTNPTVVAGVADADNITFTAVPAGAAINYVVIYKDTGTPATSALIAAIDTATNLPVTPNGGDITVEWDSGANKIFKL